MKNLACHQHQKQAERDAAVATMIGELTQAGIQAIIFDGDAPNSEIPGYVLGSLSMWQFRRGWYYWIATGPALADAIRSVYDAAKDPDSKPYCGGEIQLGLIQDFRRSRNDAEVRA